MRSHRRIHCSPDFPFQYFAIKRDKVFKNCLVLSSLNTIETWSHQTDDCLRQSKLSLEKASISFGLICDQFKVSLIIQLFCILKSMYKEQTHLELHSQHTRCCLVAEPNPVGFCYFAPDWPYGKVVCACQTDA